METIIYTWKAIACACAVDVASWQSLLACYAAIVKPKAGPSNGVYSEADWNDEVDENAQGADAYRYSKVRVILRFKNTQHKDILGFQTN